MKDNYKYLPLIFFGVNIIKKILTRKKNNVEDIENVEQNDVIYTPRGTKQIKYENMTVKELRYIASLKKIKQYSKLNKKTLIDELCKY